MGKRTKAEILEELRALALSHFEHAECVDVVVENSESEHFGWYGEPDLRLMYQGAPEEAALCIHRDGSLRLRRGSVTERTDERTRVEYQFTPTVCGDAVRHCPVASVACGVAEAVRRAKNAPSAQRIWEILGEIVHDHDWS